MTYRLQNLMLAIMLALSTLLLGLGNLSQNLTSGGYQLFERVNYGIIDNNSLTALENFGYHAKVASECCKAPNRGFETPDIPTSQIRRNQIAGDRASDEIAALHPNSRREVTMQTSDGPRRVDVFTTDRGAIESKVGRTSADASTMRQVNKDRELLENGEVTSVAWEFRRSAQTGRVGPTPRLQAELEAAGIEIRIVD